VYMGALDNKTYCLNAETGNIKWAFTTRGYITSSPALENGVVYVTSQEPRSGILYKLNASNGIEIWKQTLPYFPTFLGGVDMHSSPVLGGGMVFAASSTSAYYGINEINGTIEWTYLDASAEEFIICSPVYKDGALFIVNKFSIVALDAKTGNSFWSTFIGDELYVSPTYADGKLYIVTDQRHLYVLNATNGDKLSNYSFRSNSWSSPTIYEGRVYGLIRI
jgi:outer membrane protein assembly factor BamB